MNTLVRVNFLFPPALEAALTEALVAEAGLPGFTVVQAEAHSDDFLQASAAEQVRGRVQRRWLWMLLPQAQVDTVLAVLRAQVDGTQVRWWVEPVQAMGALG